jgi:Amt family ammonium transporter
MKSAARNRDYHFAVLYLDLDGFKGVNDSLGHTAGDSLLVEVTARIAALIRKEDTLARLSGDEFAVLFAKMNHSEDAKVLAQRILNQLAFPFLIDEREVYVSGSIGIALDADHGDNVDNLLRDADIAMYRAKSKGKGAYALFDEQLRKDVVHRLNMETELRHALDNDEIQAYFQPIVSLKSGLISGFEALARWQHPRLGLINPVEFISIAEESKLILPLDTHVLRQACLRARGGGHRFDALGTFFMSVNLSSRQLLQDDLAERIEAVLKEVDCSAPELRLSLEITEIAIMQNLVRASELLFRLKDMSVRICVDDFGTGHSSLSYLQNLPIHTLKIDRSLVSRMDQDGKSAEIVRTIISLARNLGLKVVAEGVENEAQLLMLRELQCDFGQGYLFSEPRSWERVEALLSTQPTW